MPPRTRPRVAKSRHHHKWEVTIGTYNGPEGYLAITKVTQAEAMEYANALARLDTRDGLMLALLAKVNGL